MVNIKDNRAIGRVTETFTIEVNRVIEGISIVAKIAEHISKIAGKIRISIDTVKKPNEECKPYWE